MLYDSETWQQWWIMLLEIITDDRTINEVVVIPSGAESICDEWLTFVGLAVSMGSFLKIYAFY